MGAKSQYLVNHLVTFSLQHGEVQSVEEAQARLSLLARSNRLWSQEMLLEVGPDSLTLRDTQNMDELLEEYHISSIHRCDSILSEKHIPSLLLVVCQSAPDPNPDCNAPQKKPDVHFFSCDTIRAELIRDDIRRAVSDYTLRTKMRAEAQRLAQMETQGIPNPPYPHAPNPPPANPPPYPGIRANGMANGQPDKSFQQAQREVDILNHCFDDMESFMGKLQQSAEAQTVINQRNKKKKKSRKKNTEDDLLTAKARPPPEEEFVHIFQKFKYCFSLLARLRSSITNPTSEELLHHVFRPLDMIVKATGGPALAGSVSSPALTGAAVTLLQANLSEEERELWSTLGPNWTQPRSELRGPVAAYSLVFLDGWKPEGLEVEGQGWEDPVEAQHRQEAKRDKQETTPVQPSDEMDSTLPPEGERIYSCSYDFVARNSSELSVLQGETLEVVESSKRWWKCRNRFNEVGFVPFNILEPVSHIDQQSPTTNKAAQPPLAPPLQNRFSYTPPSPPALTLNPNTLRPRSIAIPPQHLHAAEDADKVMMVNDELLQRLTNGKAGFTRSLHIPRSVDTSVPLDYHSPPAEVEQWLRGKGFSEPTVHCLCVLTGAQLFSLNKEELRAVIPEEGARVYSQITVQKALLEDARKATELETVMEKQKMKVDLKLESGTL